MPVKAYFKGHGDEVMAEMTRRYGTKKGKSVFYATAEKQKMAKLLAQLRRHRTSRK